MGNTVTVHDNMRIPMRDRITLSARVWMPDVSIPTPAILEILPYRKRDGTAARDATTHTHFAQDGYVCLRVDLRGCGESDGFFDDEYSETELSDIEDTIAWIAAQDWCSGAVGIMGISWGGFNGLQVAARRPPALKAVISLCSTVDRYADDIHYKGGCQLTENIGWAATATSWFSMPPDPVLVGDAWRDIWLARLENTPFLASRWLRHDTRDAYWQHASVCEDFSAIKAPVLVIAGWHDGYRNTPAKLLEGGTSGPVKAIIGPWNHKYPHIATPEPRIDFVTEALRWWDHWLKGAPNGVDQDPAMRAYLMDGIAPATSYNHRPGKWIELQDWPSDDVVPVTLTLGDNTLGAAHMTKPHRITTNPLCGRGFGEFFPFGFGPGELPDDQRADDALSLRCDSAPQTQDLPIFGSPVLNIDVASDQPFGQIAARLCDIAPDGASTLITFGALNLGNRDGFAKRVPPEPGTTFAVTIPLDQCAYVLPQGHQLRIALSPSYWPFLWPERGNVTLTVTAGQLVVPTLSSPRMLTRPFNQDIRKSDAVTRTTKAGHEDKTWTTTDTHSKLTITADHGQTEFTDHGLRISSAICEEWTISKTDISDASARITWHRGFVRDTVNVSTTVVTALHTDHAAAYLEVRLQAFEEGCCIFDRTDSDTIPYMP